MNSDSSGCTVRYFQVLVGRIQRFGSIHRSRAVGAQIRLERNNVALRHPEQIIWLGGLIVYAEQSARESLFCKARHALEDDWGVKTHHLP